MTPQEIINDYVRERRAEREKQTYQCLPCAVSTKRYLVSTVTAEAVYNKAKCPHCKQFAWFKPIYEWGRPADD